MSTSRLLRQAREGHLDLKRAHPATGEPYLLRVWFRRVTSRLVAEAGVAQFLLLNVVRRELPTQQTAAETEYYKVEEEIAQRKAALPNLEPEEQEGAAAALAELRQQAIALADRIAEEALDRMFGAAEKVAAQDPGRLAETQVAIACAGVSAWQALTLEGAPLPLPSEEPGGEPEPAARETVAIVSDPKMENPAAGVYHISVLTEAEIADIGTAIYDHSSGREQGVDALRRFRPGSAKPGGADLGDLPRPGEVAP